jgi:hypothetical protein
VHRAHLGRLGRLGLDQAREVVVGSGEIAARVPAEVRRRGAAHVLVRYEPVAVLLLVVEPIARTGGRLGRVYDVVVEEVAREMASFRAARHGGS